MYIEDIINIVFMILKNFCSFSYRKFYLFIVYAYDYSTKLFSYKMASIDIDRLMW